MGGTLFNKTCLRPSYSLRRQLIVSYGCTAFFTIGAVIIFASLAAKHAGSTVNCETMDLLKDQVTAGLADTEFQIARIISKKFQTIKGSAALLSEIIRDRIVGYPNQFEDDRHVPFLDIETGEKRYPLVGPRLPRDFEILPDWTIETDGEHIQERAEPFYRYSDFLSTASSVFFFQGNCDPNQDDPTGPGYLKNCTAANNDPQTGGVIHPVATLSGLADKANDIGIFLKPLFEAEPNVIQLNVYFFNSGAGAVLAFPGARIDENGHYVSSGCEWMREINPFTGLPFGGQDEIGRCRPAGEKVSPRLHNPMEREFCRDQALHPGEVRLHGPFLDKLWGEWRIAIGQAVFDRKTGEFIACTSHDLSLELVDELVRAVSLDSRTNAAITGMDGSLVAGADIDIQAQNSTMNIVDTGFLDQPIFDRLTANRFWENDVWDGLMVGKSIENNFVAIDGWIIAGVPVPLPPDAYDKDYLPDFFVFVAAKVGDVVGLVNQIDHAIHDEVADLILNSILIGLGGLFVFLFVVACVSHILTRPLTWMESTAWKIVNHADKRVSEEPVVSDAPDESGDPVVQCSPKTEIGELVTEFQVMIRGFSGTGASRVAPKKIDEIKNFVTWKDDFRQFYKLNQTMEERIKEEMSQKAQSYGRRISIGKRSRNTSSYGQTASDIIANMSEGSQMSEEDSTFRSSLVGQHNHQKQFGRTDSSTLFKRPLTRTNLGSNLPLHGCFGILNSSEDSVYISRSSLFRWVVCSIVLPLMLTNAVIAALVANNLVASFPGSLEKADDFSFDLGIDFLRVSGSLQSLYGGQVLSGSMRDLHMLTRISGWLLFGGVNRSEAFSDLEIQMVEECKAYSPDEVCPFDADPSRSPCDCAWKDPWGRQCDDFSVRTRAWQRMWFLGQARDFDPETGARSSTPSYPEFDFNPVSTKWWTDVNEMPGAEKGVNASGYETTYDRIRVSSAVQTVVMPLYNYYSFQGFHGPRTSAASYLAFEADGGYLGYAGCNYDASRYASFQSSDENEASVINPELCPLEKYGYDPRCRPWYADTKRKTLYQGGYVHMSPPYRLVISDDVGTTACSGLVDPGSGEYVGTAAINLSPTEIFLNLATSDADFHFVISTENGNDAIVGPGHPLNAPPEKIADVVLPNDASDSENQGLFADITNRMKAGESGVGKFIRKSLKGTNDEMFISFAPISARVLNAKRPDDFSRGVEEAEVVMYSAALVKSRNTLEAQFQGIKHQIDEILKTTIIVFVCMVALVTFVCIIITAKISTAIAKPLLILLRVVKRVNAGRIEGDMPPLEGGSREVTQVYTSFAKLYKIVRMSNASFFSGDFKWAHHIANDALKLFRKIGDEKAVAVACNNIGNTILALSVQRRDKGVCLKTESGCQSSPALRYFDEAIDIATREFEASETDAIKAEFAQQLADRHFNRAMCLLHFVDDPCMSSNAKEKAVVDLFKCKEYDRGVQEYMLHEKLMFKYSDIVFERLLRRIHGLSFMFNVDNTVWQVWDVNDLVEQADLMLQAAWDQDKAPLFQEVGRVGRLQQLEGAVIGLELISGKLEEASQLAMRMLVEDEYIIDSSFVVAADTVLRLMKEPNMTWSREAKLRTSLEFRRMRRAGKRTALDIERCFVFCIELGEKLDGSPDLMKIHSEVMTFYEEQCNDKDSVGLVALNDTSDSNLVIKLGPKEKIDAEQREALETATTNVGGTMSNPAITSAVDMVVSPSRSRTSDVFLIYVSDGNLWDARSFAGMIKKVSDASSKRTAAINVISIGVNVEDDAFAQNCRNLCLATRSRNSCYLPATEDNVEDVFERAAELVSSSSSSESSRMQLGITMERF